MEDVKALMMYWHEKGYDTLKTYQKLSARPDRTYPAYSALTDWIRKLHRGGNITRRSSGSRL
jgi:hypothetical protein